MWWSRYWYDWTKRTRRSIIILRFLRITYLIGFIAQQVKQHFPKSVSREKTRIEDKREIPDLSVINADQLNYTLFGAVKQLIKVVEKQSKRIKKLEEMLGIVDDDEVENDADEPYERIVCDEVDIDTIEPSEPVGV